ncbi:uncharacterized protein LOC124436332 isoform X2 [Xenia sp. Carnegie-2017]|uniref:uncharacterized protein LOC124436328 isoform X1 n=1 Tax=Xenia sp. Carnegie-2017 TaxID=2897299 RepID=UPI001F04E735|nr:uncharacterized protein LOC124436328 isoform X1 [Xenia sp. Carnegie-2017]XP_046842201.1 uncharacterized protein LOC124436332 isoform X2 [Xenia sp. Carnegie-2017]
MASNSNTTDFDSVQALNILAVKANYSDRSFMEIIRDFPTIYDKRTNGFHDKRKKANCWRRIAELLETTTEEVERRYKTIHLTCKRLAAPSSLIISSQKQRHHVFGCVVLNLSKFVKKIQKQFSHGGVRDTMDRGSGK